MKDSRSHFNNDGMDPDWKPADVKPPSDKPQSITLELIENRRNFLRGITDPDDWVDALCDAALRGIPEQPRPVPYSSIVPCFDHNIVACEGCKPEDWLCGVQHSRDALQSSVVWKVGETPMTDAAAFEHLGHEVVFAAFARQLEARLSATAVFDDDEIVEITRKIFEAASPTTALRNALQERGAYVLGGSDGKK